MSQLTPEQLEQLVHRTLRALPDRRAPAGLEARVQAALAARTTLAARPWWQQAVFAWPVWARVSFGLAALAAFSGAVLGVSQLMHGAGPAEVHALLAPVLTLVAQVRDTAQSFLSFAELVARHIPSVWLYGIIAVFAGAYALLVGVGATAYRALWRSAE